MQWSGCYLSLVSATFVILASLSPAIAQDGSASNSGGTTPDALYSDIPQFGGPTSVGGQLAEDAQAVPQFPWQGLQDHFASWNQFKARLNEGHGLQFNIDESMFYQVATDSLGEEQAASGLVRVYGQWELCNPSGNDPGMLVFKGENRHRMGTALTPFDLGFEAGSIVPTGTFFSEFNYGLTNLFWKQYFFDRQLALAIGRIDVTDFVDVYAMINPLTHFINLSFSTNPTIAVPNQGLGIAAGGMLTDRVYVQAGLGDANGQPTTAGFDTFFEDEEYFSYFEFGLTSSQDRLYIDNVHATLWHADAREAAGTPEGWGIAVTAQKFLCDKWLPFFRFGYADGDAALMQTNFSTGLGVQLDRDVFGLGVSWGQPADGTLREQFTSEVFYRRQLTQGLAITPDIQLIVDPALNPGVDVLALFGVRLRAAF